MVLDAEVLSRYDRAPDGVGPQEDPRAEFLRLACLTYGADDPSRTRRAAELLAAQPGLARGDVHVAAACCDADELASLLAADPGSATREGGPHRWSPLVYLAYARHDPTLAAEPVARSVRLLLEHGADPDSGYLWHGLPSPFTALTGAFGGGEGGGTQPAHPQEMVLARLLLEAGADANDPQTLYNRMFDRSDDHLELLFAFGLGRGDGGPWKRRLGAEAMTPTEMLLGQLSWAVLHGYDDRVRLLAAHGLDLTAPLGDFGGEGLPAYATAVRAGRPTTAALVRELVEAAGGRVEEPDLESRVLAAVVSGDVETLETLRAADPGVVERVRRSRPGLVPWAASAGTPAGVRLAVELGWDVSALARTDVPSDQEWETALHHAAAEGDVALVRLLLDLGADPDVRDRRFDSTPLGWAEHFEQGPVAELLRPLTAPAD